MKLAKSREMPTRETFRLSIKTKTKTCSRSFAKAMLAKLTSMCASCVLYPAHVSCAHVYLVTTTATAASNSNNDRPA